MTVSYLIELGVAQLTNQQLADLALQADRDRRRAEHLGNLDTAHEYAQERDALLSLIN